ncbi:hypothetical protein SISNIDRAFT_468760 [Sistotremastrum niveocremeum HHB9708]|uniref:BHLH domain-containing protein n=1 Tax=Sistotremastrum niveocremeum HHB9708 TaxID=1314777 RepID=A0A164QZ03_9AGAM|nr:hypothetical protein SISNIDRAFT_468760 [Sistotremastrum niveocremeum HHB9708]
MTETLVSSPLTRSRAFHHSYGMLSPGFANVNPYRPPSAEMHFLGTYGESQPLQPQGRGMAVPEVPASAYLSPPFEPTGMASNFQSRPYQTSEGRDHTLYAGTGSTNTANPQRPIGEAFSPAPSVRSMRSGYSANDRGGGVHPYSSQKTAEKKCRDKLARAYEALENAVRKFTGTVPRGRAELLSLAAAIIAAYDSETCWERTSGSSPAHPISTQAFVTVPKYFSRALSRSPPLAHVKLEREVPHMSIVDFIDNELTYDSENPRAEYRSEWAATLARRRDLQPEKS